MSDRNRARPPDTPLNPPDAPIERKLRELAGERPAEQQAAYIEWGDADTLHELTPTEVDEGALAASAGDETPEQAALRELVAEVAEGTPAPDEDEQPLDEIDRLDLLTELELRAEETSDAMEAVEEGFAYVPPIDPPTVPGRAGSHANAEIGSGMGLSALDEPYDENHHGSFLPDDDEIAARVRDALRADSSTWFYADRIGIMIRGGVVTLYGLVDDLIDSDNLVAVADYVAGVVEVVDRLRVRRLMG